MGQFVLVGLIGLGVLLIGLFKVRKVRASRSWSQTTGTIAKSSVREDFTQGSQDTQDSWTFTPEICYEFEVEGRTMRGDRIGFDRKGYQKRLDAQTVAGRYPVGSRIPVFFDPAKPTDSVLERSSGSGWFLVAAGSGVVLLVVAAALKSL